MMNIEMKIILFGVVVGLLKFYVKVLDEMFKLELSDMITDLICAIALTVIVGMLEYGVYLAILSITGFSEIWLAVLMAINTVWIAWLITRNM